MWRIWFWLQQPKNSFNGFFSIREQRHLRETAAEQLKLSWDSVQDDEGAAVEWVQGGRQRWGGGQGQTTTRSHIPFAIINVWNRPACWCLPLHPIAAPPRPAGFFDLHTSRRRCEYWSKREVDVLTMGCLQPGASLINLPPQSQNLAYYYPHAGDRNIYCTQKQISDITSKFFVGIH